MSQNRATIDDVHAAYELILGRAADPGGAAFYAALIQSQPLTRQQLAEHLLGSVEFASRREMIARPVSVEQDGWTIYVRADDFVIGAHILKGGPYEPHVSHALRNLLKQGHTFVDMGANIGWFTALAAHLVGSDGRVYAVEPMDKNVQLICRTVAANGFAQVTVLPFAASNKDGTVLMASMPGMSNGEIRSQEDSFEGQIYAQARRLDDLLAGVGRIDVVKVDVDGHDLFAMQGFSALLAQHRPNVLAEFHPRALRNNAGCDPEDYLDLLFAHGQSVEVLEAPGVAVRCASNSDVIHAWERADNERNSGGSTHIDLLVRA